MPEANHERLLPEDDPRVLPLKKTIRKERELRRDWEHRAKTAERELAIERANKEPPPLPRPTWLDEVLEPIRDQQRRLMNAMFKLEASLTRIEQHLTPPTESPANDD